MSTTKTEEEILTQVSIINNKPLNFPNKDKLSSDVSESTEVTMSGLSAINLFKNYRLSVHN